MQDFIKKYRVLLPNGLLTSMEGIKSFLQATFANSDNIDDNTNSDKINDNNAECQYQVGLTKVSETKKKLRVIHLHKLTLP